MAAPGNRFVVDLGKLKLKPVDQRGLAAAIQGAVLSYLAKSLTASPEQVNLVGDGGTMGMFIPDDPKPGQKR
jgi:hypothetical protein